MLISLVLLRKLQRDRREAAEHARRARFAEIVANGSPEELRGLLRAAVATLEGQNDLTLTLQAGDPLPLERLATLQQATGAQGADRRLIRAAGSRDPVTRAHALLLLSRLRLPGACELASQMLFDADTDVQLVAAGSLAHLGTPAAAATLIAGLQAAALPAERIIERLASPWASEPLIEALSRGSDGLEVAAGAPPLRASLARALGLIGERQAEPALLELLNSGNEDECISAARALMSCGGPESVPALMRALGDQRWTIRTQAARALGSLREIAAVPALRGLLADRAWWVRAAAASALGALGEPGIAALTDVAEHHEDRFARHRAREALALHAIAAQAQSSRPR